MESKEFLHKKADGMFAFAFYDLEKNEIWLSRDNFGKTSINLFR